MSDVSAASPASTSASAGGFKLPGLAAIGTALKRGDLALAIGVPASGGVKTLRELVARAKANPGKLNGAQVPGITELIWDGFTKTEGLDIVKVPYKDYNPATGDLAEGRLDAMFASYAALQAVHASGRVNILCVTTKTRAPMLPLARVASGGELARTMLALRMVLTEAPDTLLFDEVDAGIGGAAALAVGRSLARLGEPRGDHAKAGEYVDDLKRIELHGAGWKQQPEQLAWDATGARMPHGDSRALWDALRRVAFGDFGHCFHLSTAQLINQSLSA